MLKNTEDVMNMCLFIIKSLGKEKEFAAYINQESGK